MSAAPIPADEQRRLAALRGLRALDSGPDKALDALTATIAQISGCPVALVSLVDSDRQWFKSIWGESALGLSGGRETCRDHAFCAHAILQPDKPLVVPDAREDQRFFDNPLVTDSPGIRFYLGQPLVIRCGQPVGTLCVLDTRPHKPDAALLESIELLATAVAEILESRFAEKNAAWLGRLINEAENELYIVTPDGLTIEYANEQACFRLGQSLPELMGKSLRNFQQNPALDPVKALAESGPMPVIYEAEHLHPVTGAYPVRTVLQKSKYDERELVIASITDRAMQQKTLAKIRDQEQRLHQIYNETPAMLHCAEENGLIVGVSDYWLEHLGYSREDVIGTSINAFFAKESRRRAQQQVVDVVQAEGACRSVPLQMIRSDGAEIDVEVSAVAEPGMEPGAPMRIAAAVIDVTERNVALAKLRSE